MARTWAAPRSDPGAGARAVCLGAMGAATEAPTIVLMGLRGCGKSTVGRAVAARLGGRSFIDLDDLTAARLGAGRAGDALRQHGEAAFRTAEGQALGEALDRVRSGDAVVMALGGGTPTAPGAAEALMAAQRGEPRIRVYYLDADVATLAARLERDPTPRPALTGMEPREEIAHLHRVRDPLYRQLADVVIDASRFSAEEVAQFILADLGAV